MSRKEPLRTVKGMRDILPPETALWGEIEQVAREVFRAYAYREIRTPLVEPTELFARGVGEETDIVTKEMYTFKDVHWSPTGSINLGKISELGQSLLTLRPEATASVVRAYIEHKMYEKPGLKKFFYMGPMFRRERPQKGRYRQFYQIGAEAIGSESSRVDAEVIEMLVELLHRLGLSGYTLLLNSVGCKECRARYVSILRQELAKVRSQLCKDCQRRSETNPLRVLDCKVPEDQPIIDGLPTLASLLCVPCHSHFEELKGYLRDRSIAFTLNPRLVRGLDYYTRTTFEMVYDPLVGVTDPILSKVVAAFPHPKFEWRSAQELAKRANLSEKETREVLDANPHLFRKDKKGGDLYIQEGLGTQNSLLGGGRYDGLSEELGGPPAPGIGFSIGEDRLALTVGQSRDPNARTASGDPLYIAWMGEDAFRHAAELARELRARSAVVEVAPESVKLKKSLEVASKRGFHYVLVIGENELQKEQAHRYYPLNNFFTQEQDMVKKERLFELFAKQATEPSI